MATFSVSVTRDGDATILNLSGELDIASVPELREVATAELDRPECRRIVLDLADLNFLDSTGLGCWVEIRSQAAAQGKALMIRSVPLTVQRILQIGGLFEMFTDGISGSTSP
ncbi:MAG TPA: anti-sigma factor antagonist [Jatrophihabitans sp.]